MLAMLKLTGDAKLWWKTHCRDSDIIGASQTWKQIKDAVTTRYLPPLHKATKMNEFFSLRQLSSTLEEYYSKFVTLRRYAPKMTLEQQVARFCQGLIEPLNNRLETLRPTTLQDALLRAKPLAKEIKETTQDRHDYPSRRARQKIEAEKNAKEVEISSQSTQESKEKEIVDLTGHLELLKKLQREKNMEEAKAAALAREKIKENLKRTTEQTVLEPKEGEPKRQEPEEKQSEEEEEQGLEDLHMDPTPPFPKSPPSRKFPPAPPSPKAPSFPKLSSPQGYTIS
ncbi:hypothetical protein L7F22_062645 [Adiantum nelumboides]|nr:hypothetical protein [Adiantum nelumboides]